MDLGRRSVQIEKAMKAIRSDATRHDLATMEPASITKKVPLPTTKTDSGTEAHGGGSAYVEPHLLVPEGWITQRVREKLLVVLGAVRFVLVQQRLQPLH